MLLDLRPQGLTGKEIEKLLDEAHITANKNTVPNDPQKPFVTSGIRLGTPAVTSRGMNTEDMDMIAEAISLVVKKGADGVAEARAIVKTLTDNKNRTAANVRSAFTKGNGNIGTPGCVSFMFDEKGQIIIDKEECDMDADDLMMIALDAGAEDFSDEEDSYEIVTAPDDLVAVADALSENKIDVVSSEVTMLPQTYVDVTDEDTVKQIRRILDLLDEDDDVQDVYTNWSGADDE